MTRKTHTWHAITEAWEGKNRRLKYIHAILHNPMRRRELINGVWLKSWPILSRLAILYRRTLIRNTRVVTIVGSFGKTTTARAVAATLGAKVRPRFGPYSTAARAVLHIRPHDPHAVIDLGITRPGQMLVGAQVIQPDITVVTSIGSEHNRSFGTLEVTREEKSHMVRVLPTSGIAVLNGDDPNVLWMRTKTNARVITFGIDKSNDICASDIRLDWPHGTRFKLHADGKTRDLRIRLIGRHMVYPILAAVSVSVAEGFSIDQVVPVLEMLSPTPMRLEPISLPNGAYILRDEFKSAQETIDKALDALSEIPAKRRFVVLGDVTEPPGNARMIYNQIGRRIAQVATHFIYVCESHSSRNYASGAKQGGLPKERIIDAGKSVHKVVELLANDLGPGDVVLIKGRRGQRFERMALSLMGRTVRCKVTFCKLRVGGCEMCPLLEREWNGLM